MLNYAITKECEKYTKNIYIIGYMVVLSGIKKLHGVHLLKMAPYKKCTV